MVRQMLIHSEPSAIIHTGKIVHCVASGGILSPRCILTHAWGAVTMAPVTWDRFRQGQTHGNEKRQNQGL